MNIFQWICAWIACDPTPWVSHYSIMTFDVSIELFGEIDELHEFSAKESFRVRLVQRMKLQRNDAENRIAEKES